MSAENSAVPLMRKLLDRGELSFRDFVELVLYDPESGYYATRNTPIGREADYITSPTLSPVFAFALARLCSEFMSRVGDEVSTIVDIGCGDGTLIRALRSRVAQAFEPARSRVAQTFQSAPGGQAGKPALHEEAVRFFGVDRYLDRAAPTSDPSSSKFDLDGVTFTTSLDDVPRDGAHLVITNELFDALPFARLVQRGSELHELWVKATGEGLDWSEREAPAEYAEYFEQRGIRLDDGQFADISLEWEPKYEEILSLAGRGLVVTFDYGFPQAKLFHPRARRYGTAAAYSGHQVSRDLLANPGEQDLTAHVNFDDLIRSGERAGFETLFFDRQAKFLLTLGITEHPLFTPSTELRMESLQQGVALLDARDAARQLVLPDGIGHDIRVLVQGKGAGHGWSFETHLF